MAKKKAAKIEPVQIEEIIIPQKGDPGYIEYTAALEFAKALSKQRIYDPNSSATKAKTTFSKYSKDNILEWLKAPAENESKLREASIYLYSWSMHYKRLIDWNAGLLLWPYVITPLNFDASKVKKEAFKKQYMNIANKLEHMNLGKEMRNATKVALREGVFYGICWSDKNSFFIQRLNPMYCVLTSYCDGTFLFSYDMAQIKEKDLESFPVEIQDLWRAYKAGGERYPEIPAEISFCIKADPTNFEHSIPPFASVMPSLFTIANIESLAEVSEFIQNYKLIALKYGVEKGVPEMDWNLALQYYNHIVQALPEQIGAALCPFDIKEVNFEKNNSIAEVDSLSRAISNYWATVGSPSVLHGVSSGTAGVTKLSITGETTFMFGLMEQAQRLINRFLKLQPGTIKFKITFLPVTVYNQDDMASIYRNSAAFGIGISHYMATIGVPPTDIEGLTYIESDVLDFHNKLKPLSNTYMGGASENEPGRPSKDDDDLTDEGENTRESGANENR